MEHMEYITSDLHFGHKNIHTSMKLFEATRGQFDSTEEMNRHLIEAHNSVVNESDTTYHLGDFSLDISNVEAFMILEKLNGQIHFIKGNHDSEELLSYIRKNNYILSDNRPKFVIHELGLIIERNDRIYYLTHYPFQLGGRRGLRSLCGHIHENVSDFPYSLNVGVDSPELPKGHPFGVPLSFEKACELVEDKFNISNETR